MTQELVLTENCWAKHQKLSNTLLSTYTIVINILEGTDMSLIT